MLGELLLGRKSKVKEGFIDGCIFILCDTKGKRVASIFPFAYLVLFLRKLRVSVVAKARRLSLRD